MFYPSSCVHELTYVLVYSRDVEALGAELGEPDLLDLLRRFLFDQLYGHLGLVSSDDNRHEWPEFAGRLTIYPSASVLFYAPSELVGPGGMRREVIRSTALWYNS